MIISITHYLFFLLYRAAKTPPESPEPEPSVPILPTVRAGSIKAWKEEQERSQLEHEEDRLAAETAKSPTARGKGVSLSEKFVCH